MTSAIFLRDARGGEYIIVDKRDVLDSWSSRGFAEQIGDAAIPEIRMQRPSWTMFTAFENIHSNREHLIFELDQAMSCGRVVAVRIMPVWQRLDPLPSVRLRDLIKPKPEDPPTTDPVRPTRTEQTFTYELRLVDEIGVPIDGVPVSLSVSGAPRRLVTDGDGRVRVDDATTGTALAQLPDINALRDVLRPRWEQVRDVDRLTEAEEHTYIDCAEPLPPTKVRGGRLHTLVLRPEVVCAEIVGSPFEKNKAFLLNSALEHVKASFDLQSQRGKTAVAIVGHADAADDRETQVALSQARAESLKAYLRGDVDAWLEFYGEDVPPASRWGAREDNLMLHAVLAGSSELPTDTPLRLFRSQRGLELTEGIDEATRRAIIGEYMALHGVAQTDATECVTHGRSARLQLHDPETSDAPDQRIELFFFDGHLGVLPAPAVDVSGRADLPYAEWVARTVRVHTFRADAVPVVPQPTRNFSGTMFGFDCAFPTSAISHLIKFAQELTDRHREVRIGLFGHADQRGDEIYNKKLSDRRAEIAFALLTEDFERFKAVADEEDWGVDCYQAMLRGLGCNPGAIDATGGELTARAVRAFRHEYNDGAFHPSDRRPRAFGDIPGGDQLDRATKDAILDAYHADLAGAISPDRFLGPQFSGCGEFNPRSDRDSQNRRVTLAIWGQDAPSPGAFPCTKGNADACDLVPAPGDRKRCRFYRDHIREEPPRDDIEPFWDFAWLETPTSKAHLSALTTLPDCNDLSFAVQLAHGTPSELGSAGFGDTVPPHGPVLGQLIGLVRKGVAYALWTPEGYNPFEATSWFRNVPVESSPREILPPYQPPLFTIRGHGTWGVAGPPGSDLRNIKLLDDDGGPLVALRHDGKFIMVTDSTALSLLGDVHRIIAIVRAERRFVDPKERQG